MTPVWIVGNQFPQSMHNAHRERARVKDGSAADDGNSESEQWPTEESVLTEG